MGEKRTRGGTAAMLPAVVVALSVLWVLIRPDLWVWALGFAVITITMLTLAHNAGMRQGRESAMSGEPIPQDKEKADENTIVEARLDAFETSLAAVELFAYELKQGLVPDGKLSWLGETNARA